MPIIFRKFAIRIVTSINENIPEPLNGSESSPLLPIESLIHVIRGQQVMLDSDLARLYGVEPKYLKRAVKANIKRFPSDFMFELDQIMFEVQKLHLKR